MQSFKKFISEADKHCSDKCCGADVKAEDCKCSPDCPHCDCNAEAKEALDYNPAKGEYNQPKGKPVGKRVGTREAVEETFDPKHPKVVAARKAHKAGTYDGNVDKNGNAIVHINGKPHTVTKGDPAAKNEEAEQLDELSPKTMMSYKQKADYSKDKAASSAAAKILRGKDKDGNRADHSAEVNTHRKRREGERLYNKRAGQMLRKSLAKEAFEPHMMYDPETGKGYKADKEADHLRMKKMGYTHEKPEVKESLDEDTINQITAEYINENDITLDQLENMTEEELNELIGKALGGIAKAAIKTGAAAIRGGQGAGRLASKGIKKAVYNQQGNRRGTAAAKQDKAGDKAEAEARKKEAEFKRKKRIQDMKKRASDLDKKISDMSSQQN